MSETSDRVQDGISQAKDMASDLKTKATAKAGELRDSVHDVVGKASGVIGDRCDQLSDKARQSFSQGRDAVQDWEENVEGFIKERPLVAILIAAFVGIVVAALIGGRKRD